MRGTCVDYGRDRQDLSHGYIVLTENQTDSLTRSIHRVRVMAQLAIYLTHTVVDKITN